MINAEARQFIEQSRFCRDSVRRIGEMLPADDTVLDGWLAEAIEQREDLLLRGMIYGALTSGRRVDSRHLKGGTRLLQSPELVSCAAWHMEGEVADHLLAAAEASPLPHGLEAAVLYTVAAWCQEHRGGAMPPALIPRARILARQHKLDIKKSLAWLAMLQLIVKDNGLNLILRQRGLGRPLEEMIPETERMLEDQLKSSRGPLLDQVPEKPAPEIAKGGTMRRAVPRIGSNAPCPCGSGKKYKRCCMAADQERLRFSSDVSGVTRSELAHDLERHLTKERLEELTAVDVERLDPAKIPPAVRVDYMESLTATGTFEFILAAFRHYGCPPELLSQWELAVWIAMRKGRPDIIEQLLALREDPDEAARTLHRGARLIRVRDDPDAFMRTLDSLALEMVEATSLDDHLSLITGLLYRPCPALGILLARACLPLVPKKDATHLLDEILQARDRLNLSPDDPFSDILEKRFAEEIHDEGKDAAEVRAVRRRLDAKAAEVRQLKAHLDKINHDVARREAEHHAQSKSSRAATPAPPSDGQRLRDQQQKINELKSELHQRHDERAALRRDLQNAHEALEKARSHSPAAPATPDDDARDAAEENLFLPGEVPGNQPPRVMAIPTRFADTLHALPHTAARNTLLAIGRLAAGEPSVFHGVVRLKAIPSVHRLRIGSEYRLLFRLHPDRLEVIDLINRRDLEKRIRSLEESRPAI